MSERDTRDTYQRVTDAIVARLESGQAKGGNWVRPWNAPAAPVNVATGKHYRGINVVGLWAAAAEREFDTHTWGTFKQWQAKGGAVKKGEKASIAVFWKFADNSDEGKEPDGREETEVGGRRLCWVQYFSVFNVAQVKDYEAPIIEAPTEKQRIASADTFLKKVGAKVKHGGDRAFYSLASDSITLPKLTQFREVVDYYSTSFHEHAHWTGAKGRCEREFGKRFGDNAYAFEELVAELTAAFLCARLGITNNPRADHADYLASWLACLKKDKRAIFTAASKAQAAADYLLKLGGLEAAMKEAA
jgi:antirestriction protein ArdC